VLSVWGFETVVVVKVVKEVEKNPTHQSTFVPKLLKCSAHHRIARFQLVGYPSKASVLSPCESEQECEGSEERALVIVLQGSKDVTEEGTRET
jgi:hypothetical protein